MIKAYRIESDTDHIGLFNSESFLKLDLEDQFSIIFKSIDLPTPEEDGCPQTLGNFCAFLSQEQISHFINKEQIANLKEVGFHLYELELDDSCTKLNHQILFTKDQVISKTQIW